MTAAPDQAERNRIAYEANRAEHEAAERFECSSPSCGAKAGEPCRTRDGFFAQHPHRGRQKLSGYEPSAAATVQPVVSPNRGTGKRDVFRQALDLRDKPRIHPTDVLVGAAIENALGKLDTTELQAILTAAKSLDQKTTAETTADQITIDDEPPF